MSATSREPLHAQPGIRPFGLFPLPALSDPDCLASRSSLVFAYVKAGRYEEALDTVGRMKLAGFKLVRRPLPLPLDISSRWTC